MVQVPVGRGMGRREGLGRLGIRGLHARGERYEDEREAVGRLAQATLAMLLRTSCHVHMCWGTSEAWVPVEAREREGCRTQHAYAGRSKFLLRSELLHACMSNIIRSHKYACI